MKHIEDAQVVYLHRLRVLFRIPDNQFFPPPISYELQHVPHELERCKVCMLTHPVRWEAYLHTWGMIEPEVRCEIQRSVLRSCTALTFSLLDVFASTC
jgi:hypothetical protein